MRYPSFWLLSVTLLACLASTAAAEEELAPTSGLSGRIQFGTTHHELDAYTRLTGWQVSQRWYFGRQRGIDSALGFVWQQEADQMSISTDGIRFTRRF